MPKYKITLQRSKYKLQDGPIDAVVITYKDKDTPKAAYNYAVSLGGEIFDGDLDSELGLLYSVEEIPAP